MNTVRFFEKGMRDKARTKRADTKDIVDPLVMACFFRDIFKDSRRYAKRQEFRVGLDMSSDTEKFGRRKAF